jgi:hypothetical protein
MRLATWLRAAPAAPGCKANIGEPWGTKRTGRVVFMERSVGLFQELKKYSIKLSLLHNLQQ